MLAESWLPSELPMLRMIEFMPVATPVCSRGTASTMRLAIDANAKPMPIPITVVAT